MYPQREDPVTSNDDPNEQEDGKKAFTAIASMVSLFAVFIILTAKEHSENVNASLQNTDTPKDNEEDWNQIVVMAFTRIH